MQIAKLTANVEITCNLGNYQNIRLSAGCEAMPVEGVEVAVQHSELVNRLKTLLIRELDIMVSPAGAIVAGMIADKDLTRD